jgi:hypothetical protein
MPGLESDGHEFFGLVLTYDLDRASRRVVEREMQQCNAPTPQQPTDVTVVRRMLAGVEFHGKMIPLTQPPPGMPATAERAQVERTIDPAELAARRFAPADSDSAKLSIGNLAGGNATLVNSPSFIIADLADHPKVQLGTISRSLEGVLGRFSGKYGMPRPPCLVTVYLVSSADKLQKLAKQLHGLRISPQCIGYSIPEDMSMVAIVPGEGIGTLSHELFHLLVRSHFGDVPPWMDEGLAALYESSVVTDSSIVGTPNWRGGILREHLSLIPTLRNLITMDWASFDQSESRDFTKQAVNHATARYFMLYAQKEEKLRDLYRSFRERDVRNLGHTLAEDPVLRVEEVLGGSLTAIEDRFQSWCRLEIGQ